MKKLIITILASITLFTANSQAHASDRVLAGTLIGAGSGALIGQAIGGDTESTVLGTAIGGIVGFTAGSLHQQNHVSSSFYLGYNSSYPVRHHRPHYNNRDHFPRHHNYYPQTRYYHPQQKIVIKKVYKNVNYYNGKKHFKKKDFHGRQFNRGYNHHSPRHKGDYRDGRSHRR